MSEVEGLSVVSWRKRLLSWWASCFAQRQDRILLFLSILIGALTGLAVVAFSLPNGSECASTPWAAQPGAAS